MKNICFILMFTFFFNALVEAQIYSNDFSGGTSGWSFTGGNSWNDVFTVNNIYNCSVATPDNGGGNYLHVAEDPNDELGIGTEECAFAVFNVGGSFGTSVATMTTDFSTTGHANVTLSFSWLCQGQTGLGSLDCYGIVEYSIDGTKWTQFKNPKTKFSGQKTWTTTTFLSSVYPELANQAKVRLRFSWINSGNGGTNPAFAIDNIVVNDGGAVVCNNVGGTATANPASICNGATSIISLTGSTGTIQWQQSPDGSSSWGNVSGGSGATTASYTTATLNAKTYYRAVLSQASCPDVNSTTAIVTVNSLVDPSVTISADATTICEGATAHFTATPSHGGSAPSYQWKVSGSPGGTSNPVFSTSGLVNGKVITCELTPSVDACASVSPAVSSGITMTVTVCSDIEGINSEMDFFISPNPSDRIFNLSSGETIISARIFNIQGQLVKEIVSVGGIRNISLDMNHESKGLYFLQVVTSTGFVSKKLILE